MAARAAAGGSNPLRRERRRVRRGNVSESDRAAPPRLRQYPAHPAQAFGAGRAAAPAHDPASVVGHGDRKGRKDEYRHRGRVTSRKTKKTRADAHRSPVRADSYLSGFWSMPCDLLLAAPSQRFAPSRCISAAPWLPPDCPAVPPDRRRISRGEKIPHGGGPAVFPATAKTSNGRGEGCKEPRRRGPGPPCAQASADFLRDQRRRSDLFLLISTAVLRLWQRWQRLWRLSGSVNTAQSPL